jgi:hypothetical protein
MLLCWLRWGRYTSQLCLQLLLGAFGVCEQQLLYSRLQIPRTTLLSSLLLLPHLLLHIDHLLLLYGRSSNNLWLLLLLLQCGSKRFHLAQYLLSLHQQCPDVSVCLCLQPVPVLLRLPDAALIPLYC